VGKFIDLNRRFQELTSEDLGDPEVLADMSEHLMGTAQTWHDLLKLPRVVILAEAGSGKSREMKERAIALNAKSQYAFYLDLDALNERDLSELLSHVEESAFKAWLSGTELAWFFLDSVDELKLADGKLGQTLKRFAKSIACALNRAHIIVSSRPSDWLPIRDLEEISIHLPWRQVTQENSDAQLTAEEYFLDRIRARNLPQEKKAVITPNKVVTVFALLPLSREMVTQYVADSISEPGPFLEAIDSANAWAFARRPLDLASLAERWVAKKALGSLQQQVEANIEAKLQADPERRDRAVLSATKARQGAQKLALALFLARKRNIKLSESAVDSERLIGALDAKTVLSDWTEAKRQSLLRLALFDPATYGRVKFHHRSVEEYLAAQLLSDMHEKQQLTTPALLPLLFAEKYGVRSLIPSMRPIAAWLALSSPDVFREICAREPEVLLNHGDPGSLGVEVRAKILRSFASIYGSGGTRNLNVSLAQVSRLAHPGLGPTIRELWAGGQINEDVRELLIEVIWCGRLTGFTQILVDTAFNQHFGITDRTRAILCLIQEQSESNLKRIVNAMLNEPEGWPIEIAHSLAPDLFPKYLSVAQLLILIEENPDKEILAHGFRYGTGEICKKLDASSQLANELRDGLSKLIWVGCESVEFYQFHESQYAFLHESLWLLCRNQFLTVKSNYGYLRACCVAWLARSTYRNQDRDNAFQASLVSDPVRRAAIFKIELDLLCGKDSAQDAWSQWHQMAQVGLLGNLSIADLPWLQDACRQSSVLDAKLIALHGLHSLWNATGDQKISMQQLIEFADGNEHLLAEIAQLTKPYKESAEQIKWRKQDAARKLSDMDKEASLVASWKNWRNEILSAPVLAFSGTSCVANINILYNWFNQRLSESSRLWDRTQVVRAFNGEVADAALIALSGYWRTVTPQLCSLREEKNTTLNVWWHGLFCLNADANKGAWANGLNAEECRLASVYSTLPHGKFPDFIAPLVESNAIEVMAVLGPELRAQLSTNGLEHFSGLMQQIETADSNVQRYFEPYLHHALNNWPLQCNGPWVRSNLESALRVLSKLSCTSGAAKLAQSYAASFSQCAEQDLRRIWLHGVFMADAAQGCTLLIDEMATSTMTVDGCAVLLGHLFNRYNGVSLEFKDDDQRAKLLGQLVRFAYDFVCPRDDVRHQGAFTPGQRDRAQDARNILLDALLTTKGQKAHEVRVLLAQQTNFSHWKDRLIYYSRERVASETEPATLSEINIREFLVTAELPANTRDRLFDVMLGRLEQIKHDIQNHDFSDRGMLKRIDQESDMQLALALKFEQNAKGLYSVAREEEVANAKKTDIRLQSKSCNQKVAVEIKLAEKWSVVQFEKALQKQLVEKYLRHENCRGGCLLLTLANPKRTWRHPQTNVVMSFEQVIEHLKERAKQAELASNLAYRLAVVGIAL
jgi:hypothetical protein